VVSGRAGEYVNASTAATWQCPRWQEYRRRGIEYSARTLVLGWVENLATIGTMPTLNKGDN
jgi:hypothetical protein